MNYSFNTLLYYYPLNSALLPPHMRPAANSSSPSYNRPLASPTTSHQIFTYDEPKTEPDFNKQPLDPYSYNTPEGSGGEVKLPADTGFVSTSGNRQHRVIFLALHVKLFLAHIPGFVG